jgi:protein-tyrosine phosphatase
MTQQESTIAESGANAELSGIARGRVDIHSHVLPGFDDGAADLESALAMLASAAADGTSAIVATPHNDLVRGRDITASVAALNDAAREQGTAIRVLTGCELKLSADLPQRFSGGDVLTLNDSAYVLIELSLQGELSPYLQRAMFELQVAGALPILAHVERYPPVQRNPEVLSELVRQGVLMQVNADSLLGHAGRRARETAERLARSRMLHLLASDAHDLTTRPPLLSEAHERLERLTSANFRAWVEQVPRQIIQGQVVTTPEPRGAAQESRLGALLARLRPS